MGDLRYGCRDLNIEGCVPKAQVFGVRTTEDVTAGVEYLRDQGLKEALARFGRFSSKTFNCEEDARRAFSEAMYEHVDSAYEITREIEPVDIDMGYGHPGRPRKGELPMRKTEYRVSVKMEFDEERARQLSQDRGVRVLITNLPRANTERRISAGVQRRIPCCCLILINIRWIMPSGS